jgi:hypothetical protein
LFAETVFHGFLIWEGYSDKVTTGICRGGRQADLPIHSDLDHTPEVNEHTSIVMTNIHITEAENARTSALLVL